MATKQYGSIEFYRVLVAIQEKVTALPCRGVLGCPTQAHQDLAEYIQVEREACAVRAARAKAESIRRQRVVKETDHGEE